ncbi:MAG: hypothetical protein GTO18_01930 [Anaerolineales bacterium]|nr:hypothetical protein [Anaerolineales bacterium]
MKVQIVYLNPGDDIHSAQDLLGWVKAPRAILVWPDKGRVLTRKLDLVLLKRYADRRGIRIGFLTFDPEVRKDAQELGIPTFDSLDNLPLDSWANYGFGTSEDRQSQQPQSSDGANSLKEKVAVWLSRLRDALRRNTVSTDV